MKISWKTILVTTAILTVGFACELLLALEWHVRDERTLVVVGSVIMAIAVLVAAMFSAGPPPDRMA